MARSLVVGAVADPLNWERWEEAKAYLEPARARGDFRSVIEPDEALFAVIDGSELLGVATAWLSADGFVEVKLVGGRDYRRWIGELDREIGARARDAGATRLIAIGRRGWRRALAPFGWEECQPVEDHWLFERKL